VAQTLDQMRNATPLSIESPPERVPVFVPGCGQADGSCKWSAFQQAVQAGTTATIPFPSSSGSANTSSTTPLTASTPLSHHGFD